MQQVAHLRWRSQYRLQECSGTVGAILKEVEKNDCNPSCFLHVLILLQKIMGVGVLFSLFCSNKFASGLAM